MTRRFYVRTYGCQMNEHDSERIAGVLAADGMEPTDDLAQADVVVFNTCCIRENADNKFYGHLGDMKALKAERPDLQIAVGGCLAQKDREAVRARAPHVDVVFGTHNLAHAPELCAKRAVPVRSSRSWRSTRRTRQRFRRAGRSITRPGSRSRSAATIPARSASSRRCAVARSAAARAISCTRSRSSPATACARSRCSARTSTPTAATSAPGSSGRSSPTYCGRSTPWTASSASVSPRRTRRTSGARRSRRWPSARTSASTSICRSSRAATTRSRACTAVTRPSATWNASRAARAEIDDLAVTTDIIVGFPGETDADFARTLEVADEAAYDAAYTFVFSPRPGTEAALMVDDFVAPEVVHERMERLVEVVEGHALRKHEARVGRVEEILVEGPSKRDPATWSGRTRQNKLVHFVPAETTSPGELSEVRITTAAPHWLRGELTALVKPAPAATCAHPGRGGVTRHLAIVGPTASGKSAVALAVAAAFDDVEIVSLDSMQVYRGMDIGTAKPSLAERPGDSPSSRRRGRSVRGMVGARDAGRRPGRDRRHRGAGRAGVARRGNRSLRAGRRRRAAGSAARHGRARRARTRNRHRRGPRPRLRAAHGRRSARGVADRTRQRPSHRARAGGDRDDRPPVLVVRRRPHRVRAARVRRRARRRVAAPGRARPAHRGPVRGDAGRGPRRRSPRPSSADPGIPRKIPRTTPRGIPREIARADGGSGLSRTAAQAIGYKEVIAYLDGEIASPEQAFDLAVRRTRQFARRQRVWFRRDPRVRWVGTARNPHHLAALVLALWMQDVATVAAERT